MKERALEVKVGILVLVCLALFIAFIFLLGDFTTQKGVLIYADFPNSSNLKEGAPVKISGVTVGKVASVDFWGGRMDDALGRRVQVRVGLEVEPDKISAVHEDADAYITTLGVLGEKYVEIDPGTFAVPAIEPGFVIEGTPPFQLEKIAKRVEDTLGTVNELIAENRALVHDILGNVNSAVKNADGLVKNADAFVGEARPKLLAFVDRLTVTADNVDTLLTSLQAGVGDGSQVREMIADARATAGSARRIGATVEGAIKPVVGRVNKTLDSFNATATSLKEIGDEGKVRVFSTLEKVDGVLTDARAVSSAIRDGRGSVGALMADRELYDDIKEMVKDLKRHPWKFIWKE